MQIFCLFFNQIFLQAVTERKIVTRGIFFFFGGGPRLKRVLLNYVFRLTSVQKRGERSGGGSEVDEKKIVRFFSKNGSRKCPIKNRIALENIELFLS